MLKFASSGSSTISVESGSNSVVAFPEKRERAKATLTLFPTPDEESLEGTISWPGEYDIEGITVRGIGHQEGGQVSFVVEMDGKRIAFISSPLHEWTDHELELIGDIDILVLPSDDPKLAQKLIDEIDPSVLIPVPGGGDGKNFKDVLKICGAEGNKAEKEYKLKSLPVEGREVVVLG